MPSIMMKCGHRAHGVDGNGKPVCVTCVGLDPRAREVEENPPSYEGREARCAYCQLVKPSNADLAFFEYRGPGSTYAAEHCVCGFGPKAHELREYPDRSRPTSNSREYASCDTFKARGPALYDSFYCGCRGWD